MTRTLSIVVRSVTALIAVLVLTGLPTWAQQVIPGVNYLQLINGSAARPSRTYIQDPDTGSYRISAGREGFTADGTLRWDYNTTRLNLSDGYGLTFDASAGLYDGGANIIEQRNGTNGQTFKIFNSDNGADDSWVEITHGSNFSIIRTRESGSGTSNGLIIGTDTNAGSLFLHANGSDQWQVSSSGGHFLTTGTQNIGDGAGNSPINYYVEGGYHLNGTKIAFASTAPTIGSGFGTSPSVTGSNGTAAFRIDVGTGGTASAGVITMPAATTGWNCHVENLTGTLGNYANQRTVQLSSTTTSVTVENQTISTGAALAWTASDVLALICAAY